MRSRVKERPTLVLATSLMPYIFLNFWRSRSSAAIMPLTRLSAAASVRMAPPLNLALKYLEMSVATSWTKLDVSLLAFCTSPYASERMAIMKLRRITIMSTENVM